MVLSAVYGCAALPQTHNDWINTKRAIKSLVEYMNEWQSTTYQQHSKFNVIFLFQIYQY